MAPVSLTSWMEKYHPRENSEISLYYKNAIFKIYYHSAIRCRRTAIERPARSVHTTAMSSNCHQEQFNCTAGLGYRTDRTDQLPAG